MKLFSFLILILLIHFDLSAQNFFVSGSVKEDSTGTPLSYTNIRAAGTMIGTSSNKNGEYELKLQPGSYDLIASYIGYISDTVSINVNGNLKEINFTLQKTNLDLQEVIVLPGENPALEIIRKAIVKKNERKSKLKSYEFEAYTKGLIKTQDEIDTRGSGVNLDIGVEDSVELKITGILENQSKGFFKEPDSYKEIIIARKQSANFPPSINILTGGRFIQNFYEDEINFLGKDIPGPIADDALEYYYYFIDKTLAMDNRTVYQIHIEPDISTDPGFVGNIFITDSTFDLIKVDLELNRAANTGGIFDTINVFQQFSSYGEDVYMPVDYRLFVNANILNLAKFGFELNTILYDYKINPQINNDFFDKAIIKVLPEADKKDSLYWVDLQTIPNTVEEKSAYERIDSIRNIPISFWDDFSLLSTRLNWSENFSTSAPLTMYHFNRVEGNALDFGFFADDILDKRLSSSLKLSYGFADKKFKKDFSASYLLGDYRTTELSFNAYDRLNILFGSSDSYNELTTTVLALLSKYEFRDYYYSKGFDFEISGEVIPEIRLSGGFINRTDNNAFVNTNFSFFAKDKIFKANPPVNEIKVNALTAGFRLDFRKYIEDGLYRRRTSLGKSYIIFEGDITYSDKDLLSSSINFTKYEFRTFGSLNSFKSSNLSFRIFAQSNNGLLPYQMLYALPGNIDYTAQNYTFRTLDVNEIIGENVVTIYLEHYWRDELFRLLQIPLIKNLEIQLTTYFNIAYSDVNDQTRLSAPAEINIFKHPFYEAGFSIGHVLIPLELDFTWKLNHRGKNNFRFGINTFVF